MIYRALLCLTLGTVLSASASQAAPKLLVGGTVVDMQSGAPVPEAAVVVFDEGGEVVSSCVTDGDGRWTVPADWDHCRLKAPPGGKGLLASAFGFISWPIRTVTRAVGAPAGAIIKTAARAAGGAAGGAATAAAVAAGGGVAAAAAGSAGSAVGKLATEMVVGDPDEDVKRAKKRASAEGQVRVRVWKEGFRDYSGPAWVYLLDRIQDEEKKEEYSLALVDPVQVAAEGTQMASRADRTWGIFTRVAAEPAIAPAGAVVAITAQIKIAPEVIADTRMVARNLATRQDFELRPASDGVWRGEFTAPKKGPYRNHEITIAAYRSPEGASSRDKRVEDRAGDMGAWDPGKPFPVDPAFLTSRNRGCAVVTVTRP